jgi:hypothetical protein
MSPDWLVDKVEIRRRKQIGKRSKIFVFPCGSWLRRDGYVRKDLLVAKIIDENGKEKDLHKQLKSKP